MYSPNSKPVGGKYIILLCYRFFRTSLKTHSIAHKQIEVPVPLNNNKNRRVHFKKIGAITSLKKKLTVSVIKNL